mgnify:CR=1 FL=1
MHPYSFLTVSLILCTKLTLVDSTGTRSEPVGTVPHHPGSESVPQSGTHNGVSCTESKMVFEFLLPKGWIP